MIYKCEWCGKEFNIHPSRLKAKHICCSKQCQSELRKSLTKPNYVCPTCNKNFHANPRDIKNYKHVFCSSVEINGALHLKKEYDVHHIDENRLNNDPSNLLVLLKSDHIRLHNAKKPHKRDEKAGRFLPKEGTGT